MQAPSSINPNTKKKVKVQLGPGETSSNAINMLVEASGRVLIVEEGGNSA